MKLRKVISTLFISSLFININSAYSIDIPSDTVLADKQIFNGVIGSNPPSIDPSYIQDTTSNEIAKNLFETLVRYSSKEGKYIGAAAESFFSSEDGKVWTFNLRKNAKWSNGDPVTAHDFVYTFQRLVDPKTATTLGSYLSDTLDIVNSKDIVSGKLSADKLGVRAVDDYILEFTLNNPIPWFHSTLGHSGFSPVHKKTVEKYGDKWTSPENIVSNGPYKLKDYVINEKIELVKNPIYRDANNIIITNINFSIVKSDSAIYSRFQAGELDIITLTKQYLEDAEKKSSIPVLTAPKESIFSVGLNLDSPKFKDIRVRKALRYVIDSETIAQKVVRSKVITSYSWVPKTIGEGDLIKDPEFSKLPIETRIKEARKLIKDAGYSKSKPLELTFSYSTSEFWKPVFIAIQQEVNKAFEGAVISKLENSEWKVFLNKVKNSQYEVAYKGWIATFNNASQFLSIYLSNSSLNSINFKSELYDKYYNDVYYAKSSDERKILFKKLNDLVIDNYSVLPLFQGVINVQVNPKLKGYISDGKEKYIFDYYKIK